MLSTLKIKYIYFSVVIILFITNSCNNATSFFNTSSKEDIKTKYNLIVVSKDSAQIFHWLNKFKYLGHNFEHDYNIDSTKYYIKDKNCLIVIKHGKIVPIVNSTILYKTALHLIRLDEVNFSYIDILYIKNTKESFNSILMINRFIEDSFLFFENTFYNKSNGYSVILIGCTKLKKQKDAAHFSEMLNDKIFQEQIVGNGNSSNLLKK